MLNRVSWAAIAALVFMCLAIVCAALDESVFAVTFALCAIAWAILSLAENT
jgi:hypothetical protein